MSEEGDMDSSVSRESIQDSLIISIRNIEAPLNELDEFLSENNHIFTLASVFAALSVYLNTPSVRDTFGSAASNALLGGFLLALLISLIALWNLGKRITEAEDWYVFKNVGLIAFGAIYSALILLIGSFIASFSEFWGSILLFGAMFLGVSLSAGIFIFLDKVSTRLADYGIPDILLGGLNLAILIVGPIWFNAQTSILNNYSTPAASGSVPAPLLGKTVIVYCLIFVWFFTLLALGIMVYKTLKEQISKLSSLFRNLQ